VNEIAALGAVLEYPRAVAVQEARSEDCEHAGVWVRERLARAIDVEEAQGDGGHAVGLADQKTHALLGVLVEGVDRAQRRHLFLGRRDRPQRPAGAVGGVPVAGPDPRGLPLGVVAHLAVSSEVAAFAIDAHRRGDDQATHRALEQRLQQSSGAELVDRDVALDLVHALTDADHGRQVQHGVDSAQRALERRAVTDVATDELDFRREVGGRPRERSVDLQGAVIEHPDPVAGRQKMIGNVGADEARTASDQNLRHPPSFFICSFWSGETPLRRIGS
jgi:hypothetical protein